MNGLGSYPNSSASSHVYSHPYAPNGESSQPLRTDHVSRAHFYNGSSEPSQHNQRSETSSIASRRSSSSVHGGQDSGPIPAPVIRSTYAEPVFQTFKERKRAKEEALRAQTGNYGTQISHSSSSSTVPTRSHQEHPSPYMPHQLDMGGSIVSHSVHVAPGPSRNIAPPSPGPMTSAQQQVWSPASPQKMVPPPVRPSVTRPLPSPVANGTLTESRPRSTAPDLPRAAAPILDRSDTVSSVKSLDRESGFGSPTKRPLPKPPVAVNSSKSLDRGIPSGIGGVGKSTLVGPAEGYSRSSSRKLPSTVTEVSEGSADESTPVLLGTNHSSGLASAERSTSPIQGLPSPVSPIPIPVVPSIMLPSEGDGDPIPNIPVVSIEPPTEGVTVLGSVPPVIIEPTSSEPAIFAPLPSITFGDSDEDEVLTPNTGIAYGDLPVIAVSSCDAADEMPGQPPQFNVDSPSERPPSTPSVASTSGMTRIDPSAAIICAGCTTPIIGRIVRAMDQRWHPQCFTCGECGEHLEHVSSYEFNRKPYCHLDYHDKFAHRCHHCKTPIVEPRFITLDDPVLGQRYYHELHFFCSECGDPFLDPSKSSAPGTERSRPNQPEEEETNAFVIQKGHPYCERCHLRLHKPKCKGCRLPIPDVALDAMGGKWHQECFVCADCSNGFANSLFFPRDGKAFCTECYSLSVL